MESRIVIERIVPDNKLITPHWIATLGHYEGTGMIPTEALAKLLDKILAEAIKMVSERRDREGERIR